MTQVEIHHSVADAPDLDGAVVIIDVFRASNTILRLLQAGAPEVLLATGLDQARKLKLEHPHYLLLGERGGLMPAGFDGNNSPAAAAGLLGSAQGAILTTSAGTQAVARVGSADHIAFASFANAAAVVAWLESCDASSIHLLAAGFSGREPAREDDLCAEYLRDCLDGTRPDSASLRAELLATKGADRLRRLGQDDDLELCLEVNSCSLVALVILGTPPRAIALSQQ